MRIISADSGPRTPRLTPREYAARAAIEASYSKYVHLKCGHLTTIEVIQLYACWKPKGRVFYCESCSGWVRQAPAYKSPPIPEEPLF